MPLSFILRRLNCYLVQTYTTDNFTRAHRASSDIRPPGHILYSTSPLYAMSVSFDKPDLRQAGTAAKRVYDKKAKWVHGGRTSRPGVVTLDGILPITRPAKPES